MNFKISFDFNYNLLEVKNQIKNKDYYKAYRILSEMLKIGINHSDVYFLLGELCFLSSHNDIAFLWFKKSISFQNYYSKCLYYLGIISLDKNFDIINNIDEGMEYLLKFVKIDNKSAFSASAFYNLSKIYFSKSDYENAYTFINKCLDIDSNSKYVHLRNSIMSQLFKN